MISWLIPLLPGRERLRVWLLVRFESEKGYDYECVSKSERDGVWKWEGGRLGGKKGKESERASTSTSTSMRSCNYKWEGKSMCKWNW